MTDTDYPGMFSPDALREIADGVANGNHAAEEISRAMWQASEMKRLWQTADELNQRLVGALQDGIDLEEGDLTGAEFKRASIAWRRRARALIDEANQ